eukprot:999973-Amphidinium_carterae.1
MKQYSRKHFEFGLNSGGDAYAIARSIRENGSAHWNTRVDKELMHGCMDKAVLRIRIEEGVDEIRRAIKDTEYTRVFIVCGGDALAWNMPP